MLYMFVFSSYHEVTEPLTLINSYATKGQDVATNQLQEDNNHEKGISLDTLKQDTISFYGIKNEGAIPIRKVEKEEYKTEKLVPVKKLFNPTPRQIELGGWQTVILIITLILLGFVKAFNSTRFKETLKAIVNYGVAQEITREEKVFFHNVNILLTIIHILLLSLFIYQIQELIYYSQMAHYSFVNYLFIVGFIVAIYIIKYIFSLILFYIFDSTSIFSEYSFNISLYNNLLGVLLIPILCLAYYSFLDINFILYYLALPVLFLTFVLRIIRLYSIGITKGISFFYIFLYICTLEILPLVVLFRIFIHK